MSRREKESNVTLDDEIEAARERTFRAHNLYADDRAGNAMWDAAVTLLRPKLDAANAEIARLKAAKLRALNVADRLYEQAAKFKAEADKAKADMFDVAWRADELIDDAVAQPRKVTDAQRERMLNILLDQGVENVKWARKMVEQLCAILEQPAAEGAP